MQERLQKIQDDITKAIEQDTRPLEAVYAHIKGLGALMVVTNRIGRENVVAFCAGLLRLYVGLSERQGDAGE